MPYYRVTHDVLQKIDDSMIIEDRVNTIKVKHPESNHNRILKKADLYTDFNTAKEDLICRLQRRNAGLYEEINQNLNAIHRLQWEVSESTLEECFFV